MYMCILITIKILYASTTYRAFRDFFRKHHKLSTRTHRHIKIKSDITVKELGERLKSLKPKFEEIAKYTVGATCISTEEILMCYVEEYGEEETT